MDSQIGTWGEEEVVGVEHGRIREAGRIRRSNVSNDDFGFLEL